MMAVVTALRRGSVHDTARLGAFIHGTAINLIHGHVRARCRIPRGEPLQDEATAPDLAESCERDSDMLAIQTCVARLPRQDQQVLYLSLIEGLKPGEIAERLGLSAEVVRQQKSRALKRLKEIMDARHEPVFVNHIATGRCYGLRLIVVRNELTERYLLGDLSPADKKRTSSAVSSVSVASGNCAACRPFRTRCWQRRRQCLRGEVRALGTHGGDG